ncbi:hypothetical protein HAX54_014278, partial [Datura stramonium]|nr:hypothetical protein [Datura stramonium]
LWHRLLECRTYDDHTTDPHYDSYHASTIHAINLCPEDVKWLVLCFSPWADSTNHTILSQLA